ncbi:hypothetical protein DMA15_03565 [Streptomyces sp. WAC 01529]|uniref:hypothetical protein n=1 Tax=Streptomyces sp. WAC 01529 TaxID=2203205 RepID=UPI000F719FA1|nr:hypothetical protein [Streptomyces sp. WAC 01529]AZM51771.1 hypothetical protein DMA15_03565 [Streptomyces sp. WAC 01529]
MSDFGEAISGGDRRVQLEAIRDRLALEMSGESECCECGKPRRSSGSETAALALRLVKVLEALESIPDSTAVSRVDELMARRTGGSTNAARRQGGRRRGTGA